MAYAISGPKARALNPVKEVLAFRELLRNLVLKELKLRYRRSFLGFVWTMLNPLLMMVVLTVAFSTIMKFSMTHFSIFLLTALLPWTMFSQGTMGALRSIVDNAHLIHKVYVPKAVFPLAVVGSSLVNFCLSLLPLFILMLAVGIPFSPAVVFLPLSILILTVFSTGTALVFSSLNVFYRDFTHMTEVLLNAWFYLTPVIYPMKIIPPSFHILFKLNPMYYIIQCFRDPLYRGSFPPMSSFGISLLSALALLGLGWAFFKRYEQDFVFYV